MTTVRMMYRDEETRRRPGMGARPSNDVVMRTYETTSLVMLRPLVSAHPRLSAAHQGPPFAGCRLDGYPAVRGRSALISRVALMPSIFAV